MREIEAAKREEDEASEDTEEEGEAREEKKQREAQLTEEQRRRKIAELAISWDTRMEESKRKHKVRTPNRIFRPLPMSSS